MKNADCGIAMTFPFELLDIFIGAWAATFLPDVLEHRLYPDVDEDDKWYPPELQNEKSRRASFSAPDGFKHLKAVLCLDRFQLYRADPAQFHPNVGDLLALVETDLILRGLTADRISTFKARIHASTLLLCAFRDGREDPTFWTARSVSALQHAFGPESSSLFSTTLRPGRASAMQPTWRRRCEYCKSQEAQELAKRKLLLPQSDKPLRTAAAS